VILTDYQIRYAEGMMEILHPSVIRIAAKGASGMRAFLAGRPKPGMVNL